MLCFKSFSSFLSQKYNLTIQGFHGDSDVAASFSTYNNSYKTIALKYTINLISKYCVQAQDILCLTCHVE